VKAGFLFADFEKYRQKYRQKEKCRCCGGFNTSVIAGLSMNSDSFQTGNCLSACDTGWFPNQHAPSI
jgi:hypothetical protein